MGRHWQQHSGSGEGGVIIDNVRVVQLSLPLITTQPTNFVADVGGTATFTVAATTTTGITNYQWYTNGAAIPDATNSSLTISPLVAGDFGLAFSVLVSDGAYSSWSASVSVQSGSGPQILTEPASRAAVVGSSPTFSVVASTSTGITNYQWTYYGTNLPGATSQALTLTSVQPISFNGPYTVVVSDLQNSITSSPPAVLTLAIPPSVAAPARNGTDFSLTFATEVGPSYVLEDKPSLTNALWILLSTNLGSGAALSVTNSSGAPEGFYRIQVQ